MIDSLVVAFLLACKAAIKRQVEEESKEKKLLKGWQGSNPAVEYRPQRNKATLVIARVGGVEYQLNTLKVFLLKAAIDLQHQQSSRGALIQLCQELLSRKSIPATKFISIANMAVEEFLRHDWQWDYE